ncbi:hypothetical protein CDL12_06864 [Handroanthus impetiginosus]|uniref:Sodium channel modifier 1 n=1 Tax=Handroanthus impetiginosus TaxID=429701 RepID=A0A2G9HSF3_9LAMI|nr:hypothetical protein CDL12_06864 [Handroanthus impetiginosus]
MSVFGGDSWAREAQYRKRRVDDLLIEGVEASAYKRLSNGKFACLVCPKNPVLDTATMLCAHVNGSRHQAAELRRKDKELAMQEEVKKRLALLDGVETKAGANASNKHRKTTSGPLIERAQKAASEVVCSEVNRPEVKSEKGNLVMPCGEDCGSNGSSVQSKAMHEGVDGEVQPLSYRERQERELKFTAAGWKRDCHGRWFKDENVEFDSDEEDPNIVFNGTT